MKSIYLTGIALLIASFSFNQTVGLIQHDSESLDDGYVLFAPIGSTTTYLIDKCGKRINTWTSSYQPGMSVYLLPDGTLLRAGKIDNATFGVSARGGIIEKLDWNGNVIWSYIVSDNNKCQHHDIRALPNGNVLVIAWEYITNAEAISQGRDPSLTATALWSEQILEIQPVGTNGGNVVWEWHLWDHLVQDFDNAKPNFGVVADNPQLMDVNFNASPSISDWIHVNSIDYNEELDQILISLHATSEVWIIDHSTTTTEAATHSGGNSGMGGDILYRWGNPITYDNGLPTDQKLFRQHNARWIENGLPFENQIMIFNNGNGRIGGNYSTVEIINSPVSGYNYTNTLPYLPLTQSWIYNNGNPNNFYAQNISSAQQLSNGNVLIANGPSGIFFEINTAGNTVWKYVNPVSNSGIIPQNSAPLQNVVFRCNFYPSNFTGFISHDMTPQTIIENSNLMTAECDSSILGLNAIYDTYEINVFPNPANTALTINTETFNLINTTILITNSLGEMVYRNYQSENSNTITIPIQNFESGIYYVRLKSDDFELIRKIIVSN